MHSEQVSSLWAVYEYSWRNLRGDVRFEKAELSMCTRFWLATERDGET